MSLRQPPRAARVAAALVAGGLIALAGAAPAMPRTRSTSTTSSPWTESCPWSWRSTASPAARRSIPRRSRSRSTAGPSTRRPRVISAGDVQRTTVLVLDASNSMLQGDKFAAAKAAVDTFLASAPADVRIGLVAFAGDSAGHRAHHRPRLRPRRAERHRAPQGHRVYDGIAEGLDLVGTEGSRSLLVLSDGGDTSSATTLDVVDHGRPGRGRRRGRRLPGQRRRTPPPCPTWPRAPAVR